MPFQDYLNKIKLKLDETKWNINISDLYFPENAEDLRSYYVELVESDDQKYACLFYMIVEFSMLNYFSKVSILKDKNNPKVIFNLEHWFDLNSTTNCYYCGKYLILRKSEMYFKENDKSYSPFIIINLEETTVALFDFEYTSIFYDVTYVDEYRLQLNLENKNDLESLREKVKNFDNYIIDLKKLDFVPKEDFTKVLQEYSQMKE